MIIVWSPKQPWHNIFLYSTCVEFSRACPIFDIEYTPRLIPLNKKLVIKKHHAILNSIYVFGWHSTKNLNLPIDREVLSSSTRHCHTLYPYTLKRTSILSIHLYPRCHHLLEIDDNRTSRLRILWHWIKCFDKIFNKSSGEEKDRYYKNSAECNADNSCRENN